MKPSLYILSALLISLSFSCKKNSGDQTTEPRISFISELGEIKYANNNISSIGNEDFSYNADGSLASTTYQVSHVIPMQWQPGDSTRKDTLIKYNYIAEAGLIKALIIDTLKIIVSTNTSIPVDETAKNLPFASIYYTGSRIDSIEYHRNLTSSQLKKTIYTYNGKGNIEKIHSYYYYNFFASPIIHILRESITTLEYDDHPNPWNMLYKKLGTFTHSTIDKNISLNNPVKSHTSFYVNDVILEANVTYQYTYNSDGYPTSVSTYTGGNLTNTLTIKY